MGAILTALGLFMFMGISAFASTQIDWNEDMNQESYWEAELGSNCTKFEDNPDGYIPRSFDYVIVKGGQFVVIYEDVEAGTTVDGPINPSNGKEIDISWLMKCHSEYGTTTTTVEDTTTTSTEETTTTTEGTTTTVPEETTTTVADSTTTTVGDSTTTTVSDSTTTTNPSDPPTLPFTGPEDFEPLTITAVGMTLLGVLAIAGSWLFGEKAE